MHLSLLKEFRRSTAGPAGGLILMGIAAIAFLAPLLAPLDPNLQTREAFQSPSPRHPLGTNHVGQDIGSRLVHGARTSLAVGMLVALAATLAGALVGGSCALKGGFYDAILMRLVDAFLIVPAIIVLILITAYLKPGLLLIILLISSFSWAGGARIVRAQTLSLKARAHLLAARSFGGTRGYLLRRHVLPELGPILIFEFIHNFRRAVFMEAGIAFLGVCDPAVVSWGTMMKNAMDYSYMNSWMWWLIPPGMALSATILALAWIGHNLEPILEPRLREAARA
jgi:peptide/nickel transport system permease protein